MRQTCEDENITSEKDRSDGKGSPASLAALLLLSHHETQVYKIVDHAGDLL